MIALTKAEIAERLTDRLYLNRREAKQLVELFFQELSQCLIDGEEVKLSGFGNFELRQKRQRPGRNPKTGEEMPISARRVVTFRAGQKFRQYIETSQTSSLRNATLIVNAQVSSQKRSSPKSNQKVASKSTRSKR